MAAAEARTITKYGGHSLGFMDLT